MQNVNPKHSALSALNGFEHIKRFWDSRHNSMVAKVMPGECYVSYHEEIISTVLGSCIAVCIYDPWLKLGGMNHFMLPISSSHGSTPTRNNMVSPELCYGNWAMEHLINAFIKQGSLKRNLVVKLFGGARVMNGMSSSDIGTRNIEFVEVFLRQEKLAISACDVGGVLPRKVMFHSHSGRIRVKRLTTKKSMITQRENRYLINMHQHPKTDDIELF